MRTFTIEDIRSWKPCYDPARYLSADWAGTAIDFLKQGTIPIQDRFWVVLRPGLVSDKTMRLFAVWCYRQTLEFITNPDPRSLKAAETAEKYANGETSICELISAETDAWSVGYHDDFAEDAEGLAIAVAWSAWYGGPDVASAESAARAACSAAWSDEPNVSAARFAARSAAKAAARSAAKAAETDVCSDAPAAAGDAWGTAWSAAESAQRDKLIEMIEEESKHETNQI